MITKKTFRTFSRTRRGRTSEENRAIRTSKIWSWRQLGRCAWHVFTAPSSRGWTRSWLHFRRWRLGRPVGLDLFDLLCWDLEPESTTRHTSIEALQRVTILPWRSINVSTPLAIFQHWIFVADFSTFSYAFFPGVAVRVAPLLAEHPPWDLHEARVLLGAAAAARRRPVAGEHPVPSALACLRIGRRSERQRDCSGCPGRWLWVR